jgi:hypothetical protein
LHKYRTKSYDLQLEMWLDIIGIIHRLYKDKEILQILRIHITDTIWFVIISKYMINNNLNILINIINILKTYNFMVHMYILIDFHFSHHIQINVLPIVEYYCEQIRPL